jgi:hypothetical protein
MRRLLALLALGMFVTGGVIGCETDTRVDDDHGSYYKKTTTVREPDGDRTTKTEVKRTD